MTVKELHALLSSVLALQGDLEVMVNTATFPEMESGTIMEVESATVEDVQGADDSGPVGDKYPMLVIKGAVSWHEHGSPV